LTAAWRPSSLRRKRLLRAAGGFLVLVALVAGLSLLRQSRQARAEGGKAAPDSARAALAESARVALADTSQTQADSTRADSLAAGKKKPGGKGGGLFAFLRGKKGEEKPKDKPEAVPVEMAAVTRQDVPSYFVGTATVEAEQRAQVLAKIAGTVRELGVEEGDDVREGQVLLQLEDAEEKARLEELRVRAESAKREYERNVALHAQEMISAREFEDKKLVADEAQAKLQVGEIRLGYTKVKAPFSGRVTLRHVHVGEYVQINQPLFDMADFDPLLVRVYMPEKEVERIREGQTVRVVPDGKAGVNCAGRVRMISPVVDTKSGTVKVTVELENPPEELRLGAFVRVQITTDVHPNALVIPKVALVEEGGESYVYRAAADSVVKVRVETGYTDEMHAEVLVGLAAGDSVVTVGQGGLKHGTHVRTLPSRAAPADTSSARKNGSTDVATRP